jgi:hypothetical protein
MKINIKGKEIELKNTFRSMIIYEKVAGKTFNPEGKTEILLYYYSVIMASDKDCQLEFDDLLDMVDENPKLITDFSEWLNKSFRISNYLNGDVEKENENPKKA